VLAIARLTAEGFDNRAASSALAVFCFVETDNSFGKPKVLKLYLFPGQLGHLI
jgi:hypothetical protein